MPELPEVETVARDLRPLVTGATITGLRSDWPRTIRGEDVEAFAEGVIGRTITGTGRRAKLLLIELSGEYVIAVHLKMTGQLFVVSDDTPQDRFVHLVFELHDGRELRFRDIRKFGRVGVYPLAAVAGGAAAVELGAGDVFELGPEPLDPAFTLARFRDHIAGRRGRLKTLLTDQTFLAGIGNIYADEALWRARLHPLRSAASLRRDDQKRLYEAMRAVLAEAVAFRGSSIDDYTAPEGDGSMQERLQVYQRAGEACPRCGRPVHRIVLGMRSTHFCSWCQRLSAADRKAAAKILATKRVPKRRGRRWTEIGGGGGVGLTPDEKAAADRRARTERTRRAAATRRQAARGSGTKAASTAPVQNRVASDHPTPDPFTRDATAPADAVERSPRGLLMSIVRLAGVVREIGTFVILDHVEGAIALGDRVGLVGPNGAGKTTLLRVIVGQDEPDGGEVQRKRGLSMGLLGQESHFDEQFMSAPDVRAAVRHGAGDLERMERELATLESAHRVTEPVYAELQHRFEMLGGYTLDQRVDEALSGLGFTASGVGRPPSSLSGGEQTRAALARLVIANPDLLLLDEPTNHLDLDALEWLEEHLRRRQGSLLVASHDRAFLDATVNRVWELRDRRLTPFRGDYSSYHRQREERDERAVREAETQAGDIEHERDLIQKYRSQRKHTKMHEHEARLERLQADRRDVPKATKALRLPSKALAAAGPSRSGTIAVRVEELVAGYVGGGERKEVVRVPWLVAERGERIGIVGPNGAGKTTLLRTIAGELPPLDGTLSFGQGVSLGYLAQLRGAAIPGTTVLDALLEAMPVIPGEARGYLARFLFRGDDVNKEVRTLSGGERSRLELALLGIMPSNLLLLDEPTNHLDIPAREAIESFLRETPATVLVVSHDRRLLETICDRLWVVADGLAVPFAGGYRQWRAAIADGWTVPAAAEAEAKRLRVGSSSASGRAAQAGATAGTAADASGRNGSSRNGSARECRGAAGGVGAASDGVGVAAPSRSGAATAVAAPRPKLPKLSKDAYRRQKATVEAELTRLGLRKNHLEMAIGNPATAANFVELRRITSELADVDLALNTAEEQWLELEERAP